MIKVLHIFRHGQTDWNNEGRLQGHTDIPLNIEGQRQALALREYFQSHPVELFASSDLLRAQQTAHIAKGESKGPHHTFFGLRESHLGALEGLTRPEVFTKFSEEDWKKWSSTDPAYLDFAFPGAESARQTLARVQQTLIEFCEGYEFHQAGICSHGLVIRRLLHNLNPALKEPLAVPNCAVFKIHWSPEKGLYFNS